MRRLLAAMVLLAASGCAGPPTMLLVGDSNVATRPAAVRDGLDGWKLDTRAQNGAAILPDDCLGCSTVDWAAVLEGEEAHAAVVVELGVNDTIQLGTPTTQGFADYPSKVRWLLDQLPEGPVYWSNLPCHLLPAGRATGCAAVNEALTGAEDAGQLTVVDWASVARADHYGPDRIHLTFDGVVEWSRYVAEAID